MQSRLSILVNMVRAADLELIGHYPKSNRLCADVRAKNGVKTTFQLSTSRGSDPRGDLNEQARMRRFAVANGGASVADVMPVAAKTEAPAPKTIEQKPAAIKDKPRKRITMKNIVQSTAAAAPAAQASAPVSAAAQELTPKEFYKLCDLIKRTDFAPYPSLEALALHVRTSTIMPVTEAVLSEAMEAVEMAAPDHWNPPLDPHVVLARELAVLMKSLGNEPSREFTRLLAGIAA